MNIIVAGDEYEVHRAKLRQWFELEEMKDELRLAAESGDIELVADKLVAYLSAASGVHRDQLEKATAGEVVEAYVVIDGLNALKVEFPIFDHTVYSPGDKYPEWDYAGRSWFQWVHILANSYGWSLEYISNLEIEDGIALIQEVLVEEQLRKEWEWGLSEVAYDGKTGRLRELPRPVWMRPAPKKLKKQLFKREHLPMGNIVLLDESVGLHGTAVH